MPSAIENTLSSRAQSTESPIELTMLMPCLNEAETLAVCIDKARQYLQRSGVDGEVLIADNGSSDGSQEIARANGARVINVSQRGYGAALNAGIAEARGAYTIMGDADDSYDFSALDVFLQRLRAGDDLLKYMRPFISASAFASVLTTCFASVLTTCTSHSIGWAMGQAARANRSVIRRCCIAIPTAMRGCARTGQLSSLV